MANTTITPVRVTKANKYETIIAMLEGKFDEKTFSADNHSPVTFGKNEAISFLTAEMDALAKKNSGERKQTATQKENESFKEMIYTFLANAEANFEATQENPVFNGCTCTEILQGIPELQERAFQNQKISALCNQLEKAGKLEKKDYKNRKHFSVKHGEGE